MSHITPPLRPEVEARIRAEHQALVRRYARQAEKLLLILAVLFTVACLSGWPWRL